MYKNLSQKLHIIILLKFIMKMRMLLKTVQQNIHLTILITTLILFHKVMDLVFRVKNSL
jgi:hypothetical protein